MYQLIQLVVKQMINLLVFVPKEAALDCISMVFYVVEFFFRTFSADKRCSRLRFLCKHYDIFDGLLGNSSKIGDEIPTNIFLHFIFIVNRPNYV
jgi:hypothetical protein